MCTDDNGKDGLAQETPNSLWLCTKNLPKRPFLVQAGFRTKNPLGPYPQKVLHGTEPGEHFHHNVGIHVPGRRSQPFLSRSDYYGPGDLLLLPNSPGPRSFVRREKPDVCSGHAWPVSAHRCSAPRPCRELRLSGRNRSWAVARSRTCP